MPVAVVAEDRKDRSGPVRKVQDRHATAERGEFPASGGKGFHTGSGWRIRATVDAFPGRSRS
jgi:hypothetical protein